jgi:hypothetical protein
MLVTAETLMNQLAKYWPIERREANSIDCSQRAAMPMRCMEHTLTQRLESTEFISKYVVA